MRTTILFRCGDDVLSPSDGTSRDERLEIPRSAEGRRAEIALFVPHSLRAVGVSYWRRRNEVRGLSRLCKYDGGNLFEITPEHEVILVLEEGVSDPLFSIIEIGEGWIRRRVYPVSLLDGVMSGVPEEVVTKNETAIRALIEKGGFGERGERVRQQQEKEAAFKHLLDDAKRFLEAVKGGGDTVR